MTETKTAFSNSCLLFRNSKKRVPTYADYQGEIVVAGIEYWANLWVEIGRNGQKYLALRLAPKQRGGFAGGQQ